ncbi:MAG TPA: aryl-sulfate sulfotransferase [Candidatus Acidoferrales bacterium]|nr:aryl-sulfate sulfotransferase [Candidatus Acidoferrales bacterium]
MQTLIWAVNGIAGGNSTVGTIDASGDYTAPANPPSITATITATAAFVAPSQTESALVYVVAPGVVAPTMNPQVALYTIAPPAAANVTIQFGPTVTYGKSTWTQTSPAGGGSVGTYVAGMLASTPYHMQATVQFPGGVTFTDTDHAFTTGAISTTGLPTITATTTAGMTPQSGVELLDLVSLTPTSKVGVAATDLNGNIVWTYNPGSTVPAGSDAEPVKLLPNGHMLANFVTINNTGVALSSVLQEVDLAGNVIWQLSTAQLNAELAAATCAECNVTILATHHDIAILPNGHLVVIADTTQVISGTTVYGDVIIDLDQNHNPVWAWNEFNHLDINRRPYSYPDWTHTNAVLYSPSDGDLVISIRHQNWLIKIDYDNGAGSGDIVWHLGYQGDFTLLNADESADNNNADWFYAQHGPSFTTTNTNGKFSLVLFDNGDDRGVAVVAGGTCGVAGQPACYSTVPLLNLDETAMTATLAFHPTTPDYSYFGGNAEMLSNGNVEYDECAATTPAENATVYEVTQSSSSQTVWHLQVTGQYAYRGMRIPSLYPGVQW